MTEIVVYDRDSSFILVTWEELEYPALQIKLSISCAYQCDLNNHYLAHEVILPPTETAYLFDNLYPGSECEISLIAVYNPTSRDHGIRLVSNTLSTSK